jgi:2',3'-cyclic-nucleotide 2'-phosphodiesterase (5'-nucleotidase family)
LLRLIEISINKVKSIYLQFFLVRSRITFITIILPISVLLLMQLYACKSKRIVSEPPTSSIYILDTAIQVNPSVVSLIIPYKKEIDSLMSLPVAEAAFPITKSLPESLLGNLITDVIKEQYERVNQSKLDVIILNQGGLRIELPQGTITRSMVFELMPFDNELVVFSMKGKDLIPVLNHIAVKGGMPVAGIQMGIKDNKAVNIKINGVLLKEEASYKIATSDYLLNGGDKFEFKPIENLVYTKNKIRDLIMESFIEINKSGKLLSPQLEQRVYYAE